jgi:hypothetical protein
MYGTVVSNYGILIGKLTGNILPLKPKRGIKCNVHLIRKVCGDVDFPCINAVKILGRHGKFVFVGHHVSSV